MNVVSDLLSSKTSLMVFLLVVLLVVLAGLGHVPWVDVLGIVKVVVPVWLGAQGVTDAAAHVTGANQARADLAVAHGKLAAYAHQDTLVAEKTAPGGAA
jgi:hypothetical protein